VRELWLGNLAETINEKKLYSHFFIYGEIEKIEVLPHKSYPFYAFVRFKLTSCTSRAFDQSQGLEIDGQKIKVQFSDYNKRPEIVGDVLNYDLTYSNCTTLFVAFSVNT
jgi:RNA recognition motif-containing protein